MCMLNQQLPGGPCCMTVSSSVIDPRNVSYWWSFIPNTSGSVGQLSFANTFTSIMSPILVFILYIVFWSTYFDAFTFVSGNCLYPFAATLGGGIGMSRIVYPIESLQSYSWVDQAVLCPLRFLRVFGTLQMHRLPPWLWRKKWTFGIRPPTE